jgi:hypothetical protein
MDKIRGRTIYTTTFDSIDLTPNTDILQKIWFFFGVGWEWGAQLWCFMPNLNTKNKTEFCKLLAKPKAQKARIKLR